MENLVQGQPAESIESLENITFVLSELWSGLSDLSSIYSAKAGGEDQLPTVTDQLKNTNMCIVQALASLVECVNALVR